MERRQGDGGFHWPVGPGAGLALVTSNVMRIDPQLFRAKSLKVKLKIDGFLSDLLELLAKCK